jgi:hypothetical protein
LEVSKTIKELQMSVVEAAIAWHERNDEPEEWEAVPMHAAVRELLAALEPGEASTKPARWMVTQWQYTAAGDRVRLGGQEAVIEGFAKNRWHVDNTDPWHPKPWEHTSVLVKLQHLPAPINFPPASEVEVLADQAREAQLVLGFAFDATEIKP